MNPYAIVGIAFAAFLLVNVVLVLILVAQARKLGKLSAELESCKAAKLQQKLQFERTQKQQGQVNEAIAIVNFATDDELDGMLSDTPATETSPADSAETLDDTG